MGESDKERDFYWNTRVSELDADDIWKDGIFDTSKRTCYRMFHGFYESDSWDWSWDWNFDFNFKLWFKDLMPKIFTNIDPSVRWWQRWRVETDRPFDKDGTQCTNIIGDLFSWF